MKPLHHYFLGTGAWYFAYGVQVVGFAWIVTIVLNESARMVGFAQMAFLTPAMIFMLVGGSLADQFGGRRIAIIGHIIASIAPLFLTVVIATDHLSYSMVILFALIMGSAQALITPARDGLLTQVADGKIQRLVVKVSLIQFSVQMFGFIAASFADDFGAIYILSIQFVFLSLGGLAYYRMKIDFEPPPKSSKSMTRQILQSILEGYRSVRASPDMSAVVLQNCAVGIFFMGSYTVTLPLLIRDVYQGSSAELSWVNVANALGLILPGFLLMRFGHLHRPGRALMIAHGLGAIVLAGAGLGLGMASLVGFIFCWGLCGGIAMPMSRAIMQEKAPDDQRARMMAFYSFSFMGSGPLGALLSGFLVDWQGPATALIVSSAMMFCVVVAVSLKSSLWRLRSHQ